MRIFSDFDNDYIVSDNYNSSFIYDYIISKSYEWHWTQKIIDRCLKHVRKYKDYSTYQTGKILEWYVYYNIRESLGEEGFKWRRGNNKLETYYIRRNYQTKRQKKNGGIDLFISITDNYNHNYYCKIECSNWNNYKVKEEWLEKKIGYVHKRYSKSNVAVRCSVIPLYHIDRMKEFLDRYTIIPIAIEEQIIKLDLLSEKLKCEHIL